MTTVRLGTRRSVLATTQSRWVAARIREAGGPPVELVELTTTGDVTAAPLASLGGTGVFVSMLREALLAGEVDLAVHSLKDLPTAPAEGLVVAAVPVREDPRDVLVARDDLTLAGLPGGARVGTGSPRRAAQLRALGLGLDVVDLRGNVDTRLREVADGRLDAVVLARAGLLRLGRAGEATDVIDPALMLPAPGQGALAVECRAGDRRMLALLASLDDRATRVCVTAERAVLATLGAGCAAPLGALAELDGGAGRARLRLRALVAAVDGSAVVRRSASVPFDADAETTARDLGHDLADQLLDGGAAELVPRSLALAAAARPSASFRTPPTTALVREGDQ
ncbi:MAG: hydroxymethylbilane synthase [Actinomycetales bacterium]|nr:hydroxymethylbilane synthase [Actinomycetales bacterium]